MVKILVDVSNSVNFKLGIIKAKKGIGSRSKVVDMIIEKYVDGELNGD